MKTLDSIRDVQNAIKELDEICASISAVKGEAYAGAVDAMHTLAAWHTAMMSLASILIEKVGGDTSVIKILDQTGNVALATAALGYITCLIPKKEGESDDDYKERQCAKVLELQKDTEILSKKQQEYGGIIFGSGV